MNKPRKRRYARHNPPRRNRRYRRNPAVLGVELPPLQSVLYAGAGFVLPPVIESYIMPYLPLSWKVTATGQPSLLAPYVARIGSVFGLTLLAKEVLGSHEAKMVAIGGGAYVLTTIIRDFAPDLLPKPADLVPKPVTTTTTTTTKQVAAYTRAGAGMSAYTRALGAPAFGARRPIGAASAAYGGMNVVASRFRRFQ